ncbi:MAG TPA: competence/damage-inducible protein A [Gemmatimonadaceae bacterium]|nr:competence/damage-inducible protein A [Gemmatimonadaceae bacterium]
MLRVELLTIGDELLLGYTVDTNAAHLARALAEVGIVVSRRATVADDAQEIASAVREALDRTGAVITTGGLGPTADDRTRPAIAALFGRALHRDDAIVATIEAQFRAMGYAAMPPANVTQAMVPEGARLLENRHGTAPGLWLEDDAGRFVAMLPGVPREMRGMLADVLLPLLRERAGAGGSSGAVVLSRTVRTTGIGESALAERLGELAGGVDGLPLAFLPGWEGVDLRLTVRGADRAAAERALDAAAAKLRERAARWVYGEGAADLAAVVLQLCRERAARLATAESCTGGLLGGRLTAISGASDVYLGGVVAYDNAVKERLLGVPAALLREHGAVSEAVAVAMARGACDATGATVSMAITGVAGPGGGTPEKPVGTVWLAAHALGETRAVRRVLPGDREEIRRRATQGALDLVRRALQGV